jgi:hypothetical protein
MTTTDQPKTYFKWLNDTQFGNAVSFISGIAGILGGPGFSILTNMFNSWLNSVVFGPSDTDQILGAIADLKAELDKDFHELGFLILTQTQLIDQVITQQNQIAMAQALEHSQAALAAIGEFVSDGNQLALQSAKDHSNEAVSFFTGLPLDFAGLTFYLPGLVKATIVRLAVVAAEPPTAHEKESLIIQEFIKTETYLNQMISRVEARVDSAHIVTSIPGHASCLDESGDKIRHVPINFIAGFSHDEYGNRLAYFNAQRGDPCDRFPHVGYDKGAEEAAYQARSQGANDELAALGIPFYRSVLKTLQDVTPSPDRPPLVPLMQDWSGDATDHVTLSWSGALGGHGGVAQYKVSRDGQTIAVVTKDVLTITDSNIPDGGELRYTVTAVDTIGDSSKTSRPQAIVVRQRGQSGLSWSSSNKIAYCRRVGAGGSTFNDQHLSVTMFDGTTWDQTSISPGGLDWGYDTGRAWLTVGNKIAYCRRVGAGGSTFNDQHLSVTMFDGTTWDQTSISPGGLDWGYDT